MGGGAGSGKIGAMVGSHNRGGQYLRARTTPTNPRTGPQTVVRNAVRTLASTWSSGLTQDERDSWAVYAANVNTVNRIGDTIQISGIAQYIRSNVPRVQAGLSIISDAPVIFDIGQGTDFPVINSTAGSFALNMSVNTFSAAWNDTTQANTLLVYTSRPQNAGINFFNGPYQLAGISAPDSTNSFNFTMPFVAGPAGSQVFIAWRVSYADGRLTSQGQSVTFPV
jgi:hypothetical protein